MAGARFEASLTVGPLWAYLRLGADGIVYFDPFHFEVTAFAELGAGITIDVDLGWFGHIRITISVHLHADVLLEGPEFRGKATIDLDVTSATIAFGDWSRPLDPGARLGVVRRQVPPAGRRRDADGRARQRAAAAEHRTARARHRPAG